MRRKRMFISIVLSLLFVMQAGFLQASEINYRIVDTDELKKLLETATQGLVVVDARNQEEYQEVHIKNAINIPVKKFEDYSHLLPADKSTQIVFYCNGVKCGKSKKAANKALEMGYRNVLVYAEGLPVWEESGLPISTGPDYEKRIETTKISPTDLNNLIQSGDKNLTIVDVRDPEEYKEGHISGAINIPVATFASRSGVLDKKKRIIVYCNAGNRSYNAYRKLMKLSYKNINQALFHDWKEKGLHVATSEN
jgi:rhodanese-related sulfurtransferase